MCKTDYQDSQYWLCSEVNNKVSLTGMLKITKTYSGSVNEF